VTTYPTGEQIELVHGDQSAVVVQVGGGLRMYGVAGRAVVDGFDVSARVDGGRGQVLAPWPNRVRDGRYRWAGQDLQLALSEAASHNAIHGLVRWSEWSVVERSASAVTLATRVWPQPGYPFLLDVTAAYVLGAEGLSVALTGRNAGEEALPYGVAQHPYLTAGTELVDDSVLTVPASSWLRTDRSRPNPWPGPRGTSAPAGRSATRCWTPHSPNSTATETAASSYAWRWSTGRMAWTSGAATAPIICRCFPGTRWRRSGDAGDWRSNPCPVRQTRSTAEKVW